MENVIFTDDNVPIFPHLLAHYIIDNDLAKVAYIARAVPLETILVEAVEHENRAVIELVAAEETVPNVVFFERDIRNIRIDRPFNANQATIINEICDRFNWPGIDVNRNDDNEKDGMFEQDEKNIIDLSKVLAATNSSLRQDGLTIGSRRQKLLDRARFVRQKWRPNLNVYVNDTDSTSFKEAFVVLCTIAPQLNDIMANIDYLRLFNTKLAAKPTQELLQLRRQLWRRGLDQACYIFRMYLFLWLTVFIINCIGWLISAVFQTHKNFDLFGSISFCACASVSLVNSQRAFPQRIQTLLVIVWALRLGYYLFTRALERGDKRLEKYDQKPVRFLIPWSIQIVWVMLMMWPTVALNLVDTMSVNNANYIGDVGFAIEFAADYQKHEFLQDANNQGKFIKSGVWSVSRHPNYFGEILLWLGLFISAAGQFTELTQYASGLSVVFIYYLLRNVSGVNLLEKNGQKRWGMSQDYKKYCDTTPILVPMVPIYK